MYKKNIKHKNKISRRVSFFGEISSDDFSYRDLRQFIFKINKLSRNMFVVLNIYKSENKYSDFLKWLLSPWESHNFYFSFLKKFLSSIPDIRTKLQGVTRKHICYDDVDVCREVRKIDLLLHFKDPPIIIVIENKIFAPVDKKQLEKYKKLLENKSVNKYVKFFILLSLKEEKLPKMQIAS